MKQNGLNKWIRTVSVIMLVAVTCNVTWAHAADVKQPIVVTAENLDQLLTQGNTDIALALNSVAKARDNVSIARAKLLPSLNLSLGYSTFSLFSVVGVACLVPFLFPVNWYDYYSTKSLSAAQAEALHVMRLNTYGTAYTLLVTVAGDQAMVETKATSTKRLSDYTETLKFQAKSGIISEYELLKGEMELGLSQADLLKSRELVTVEMTEVRQMLGMGLNQPFAIAISDVPAFSAETASAQQVLDIALQRSPERKQMDFMIQSANWDVKRSKWAFLSGCGGGVSAQRSHGEANNGAGFSAGISINLGFGYFPSIDLARRNVNEMKIRKQQLHLEFAQQIEAALASMSTIKEREAISVRNTEIGERMLSEQLYLFEIGKVSVREVLDTLNKISAANLDVTMTRYRLAEQRISLQRVTVEDKFFDILAASHQRLMQKL